MKQILVTGAGGFLGKYIYRQIDEAGDARIVTLGKSSSNDIVVDLCRKSPEIDGHFDTVYHLAGSCNDTGDARAANFITTRNLLTSLEADVPGAIVYFSSVEVYGRESGENWSEADIVDPSTPVGHAKLAAEELLVKWCADHGVTLTVMRLPAVVGTGMRGPLADMVKRIYRGTYHHIAGNEARMSVVHAVDVARAAVQLSAVGGIYNFTDGVNPTIHDLAEGFAHRLNDKKIMTLSTKRAARWAFINDFIPGTTFDRKELRRTTTSLTFSSAKAEAALGWKPNSVVEYLTTHNYDNDPF